MTLIGTRPEGGGKAGDSAMPRWVERRGRHSAATGADITVVFERPPRPPITSPVIEVAHAPKPKVNAADDEILRRLRAADDPEDIRVVTSDRALADIARALGALIEPAEAFRNEIEDD